MIDVRSFDSLGAFQTDWLNAKHHFSFGHYHDHDRMSWGALRVWNDDEIQPHTGFAPHPHENMEIITYVREGAISHEDSLGNKGRTLAGDVQVMSAGSGIRHSEYNHEDELTRIFQIWIMPDELGGDPYWDARAFPRGDHEGDLVLLASGYGEQDALPIRAQARVYGATLKAGQSISYDLAENRHGYLAPAKGRVSLNDVEIKARDGVAIKDVARLNVTALDDSEIVLVDTK